jgi:hypothetical protein
VPLNAAAHAQTETSAPQSVPEEPQSTATTGEYSYWPAGR